MHPFGGSNCHHISNPLGSNVSLCCFFVFLPFEQFFFRYLARKFIRPLFCKEQGVCENSQSEIDETLGNM